MTDLDSTEPGVPPLPGLEPPRYPASGLEDAARRTLAALNAEGLLSERHALTCALILELAATVAEGRRKGKASAAAMAAAQLREALESLPEPIEGGDEDDAWSELVEELRGAARRATTARHPT